MALGNTYNGLKICFYTCSTLYSMLAFKGLNKILFQSVCFLSHIYLAYLSIHFLLYLLYSWLNKTCSDKKLRYRLYTRLESKGADYVTFDFVSV